jgi:molybdenum cofactor sulfurtransferase
MGFFKYSRRRSRASETPEERSLAYNDHVARLRKSEYDMLKGKHDPPQIRHEANEIADITYLDHGGTTLASKSLLNAFTKEMQSTLLANPHSDAANPSASSTIVTETRKKVLRFLNANPDHFDVVFTANATASVKLVMDCFSGLESGFNYYYHLNSHTSLVGVRELATRSHCFENEDQTEEWLDGRQKPINPYEDNRTTLFAYPAQSNMNGERLPLRWAHHLRSSERHADTYTLLDAAAFVSTSPLDLSDHISAPDFIAMSFYKIFGFPDLGALVVRKASAHILDHRKYFGGGTTEMTTCLEEKPWVARKESSVHARLEDGTVAIRSVLALHHAFDNHRQLFGTMADISQHTTWLARKLYERLNTLQHANGIPVCHIYKATASTYGDARSQGATVALNIRQSDGSWMGPYAVGAMLRQCGIQVRAGSLCNPAGMAAALDLSPYDIKMAYDEGFRCNQQDDIRMNGVLFGMVRVTLGAMSTLKDVETFAAFVEEQLLDRNHNPASNGYAGTVTEGKTDSMSFGKGEIMSSTSFKKSHKKRLSDMGKALLSCLF